MARKIPEVDTSPRKAPARRWILSIWLIPLLALLVSGWFAYRYFSQLGPEIRIHFPSSGGLVANQSQIRFRDVPIGMVKKISLEEGKEGVVVTARMNRDALSYLNDSSRFWIVKARIDMSGVQGLDTLISGTYIELYAKPDTEHPKREFVGLDAPYIPDTLKGKRYKLRSRSAYDLSVGSLVYYRNINVGKIEKMQLSEDGDHVDFEIFVQEPYTRLINAYTQFWDISDFSIDMNKARVHVDLASLRQIAYGGIAFSSSSKKILEAKLSPDYVFPLYANEAEARQTQIGYGRNEEQVYQMHFPKTPGKLSVGAPIEFSGFQVGRVLKIESDYDARNEQVRATVIAKIMTSAFYDHLTPKKSGTHNLEEAVRHGLRAKLTPTNALLNNILYIDLVFDANATPAQIVHAKPYPLFPTIAAQKSGIMENLSILLAKVEHLIDGIDQTVYDTRTPLTKALGNVDTVLHKIDRMLGDPHDRSALSQKLGQTLQEFRATLRQLDETAATYSQDSKFAHELETTLQMLTRTSESMQRVLDKIEAKPNALIFGE